MTRGKASEFTGSTKSVLTQVEGRAWEIKVSSIWISLSLNRELRLYRLISTVPDWLRSTPLKRVSWPCPLTTCSSLQRGAALRHKGFPSDGGKPGDMLQQHSTHPPTTARCLVHRSRLELVWRSAAWTSGPQLQVPGSTPCSCWAMPLVHRHSPSGWRRPNSPAKAPGLNNLQCQWFLFSFVSAHWMFKQLAQSKTVYSLLGLTITPQHGMGT